MKRLLVWAERGQADFIRSTVAHAGLELVRVGASSSTALGELAEALGVEAASDLRQAAQADDIDVIWIAAPDRIEPAERRLLREMDRPVFTCEPRPVHIGDLLHDPDDVHTGRFVPLFRRSDGYRAAVESIAEVGPPQLLTITITAPSFAGSLLARLYDAMDLVDTLCPQPDELHAALSGPLGVPETLEGLHGHIAGSIRFAGACTASFAISDRSGVWQRRAILVGAEGTLTITDLGFTRHDRDGNLTEWAADESVADPGTLVAARIRAALEHGDGQAEAPPNASRVLALCEAARLSCRTGQPEIPAKIVEMFQRL